MTYDAIVGARYYDTVYDTEFTIVDVESDESDSVEPDEITVVLDYEDYFSSEVEVTLEQFRNQDDIEVVHVPGEAE